MSLDNFAALRRDRTAHEYVRSSLRAAILNRTLAGGVKLVQSEIAAELSVSTTPVREALRELAAEGLVVFDPHHGATVRSMDIEEVREIYQMRIALEPLMVRRVVEHLAEVHFGRAEAVARQMAREHDVSIWVNLNRTFHGTLSEPPDGGRLASILSRLRDSASAYVSLSLDTRPNRMADANKEHLALIKLYRERDADAITKLTTHHLEATLAVIEDAHELNPILGGRCRTVVLR